MRISKQENNAETKWKKRLGKGKKCKQWVYFLYIYRNMRISKPENNAEEN